MQADVSLEAEASPYHVRFWDGSDGGLPLVIEAGGRSAIEPLTAWLHARADWTAARLTTHGALLLRGFAVQTPNDFESVARAIAPDLRNDYLGTPMDRLTEYVFPASDVPAIYPVGQHCEMSYLATPPERLLFGCLVAPPSGGETPLVDFRKIATSLDPRVRERFEQGGVRITRNFRGPASRRGPWARPRWDRFFETEDRKVVAERCRAEGIEHEWLPGDELTLRIPQRVYRDHPRTGERVWYNQLVADHIETSARDYRRIFRIRPTLRHWLAWQMVRFTVALKRISPPRTRAFFCTYADGAPIPAADMEALRDTVWRHMVLVPWQAGDVLVVDNRSVSHGRMPYRGTRRVVACLAGGGSR